MLPGVSKEKGRGVVAPDLFVALGKQGLVQHFKHKASCCAFFHPIYKDILSLDWVLGCILPLVEISTEIVIIPSKGILLEVCGGLHITLMSLGLGILN